MLRIVLLAISIAAVARPAPVRAEGGSRKVAPRSERRFDHQQHARLAEARAGRGEPCGGACHRPSAQIGRFRTEWHDKREHERCFGACHGGFQHQMTQDPQALSGPAGRVCFPCHGTRLRFRPQPGALGPVASASQPDHVVTYSHKLHMAPDEPAGSQCAGCHGTFGEAPPRTQGALRVGHPSCAACHQRTHEPLMSQCSGCHLDRRRPAASAPVMAPRPANPYAVTGAFDHVRHASSKRVGTRGRACLTCHANIAQAQGLLEIPLPTMQGCYEACHDGQRAFSATGATCTRCHQRGAKVASSTGEVPRFSHARHQLRGVNMDECRGCHRLGADFEAAPATRGQDHQPCSDARCHAKEFFVRAPMSCRVCHQGEAPWVKQTAILRRRSDGDSEYRAGSMSHKTHITATGIAGDAANDACTHCHGDLYRAQSRQASGHGACAPSCHGAAAQPSMEQCGGCHQQARAGSSVRGVAEWSVATQFTHDSHRKDPRGQAPQTPCVVCHLSIPEATRIDDIRNPPMRSCDACHNGIHAFKTTGFECYQCHARNQP